MVKSVTPGVAAIINSGAFFDCDLYTITTIAGPVLRYTTADFPVLYNGALWPSNGLRIDQLSSKTQAHWKVGLDVDNWVVVVMPRPFDPITGAAFPDKIGSAPWLQAAQAGALDGADFQVDRAVFASVPQWPLPVGGLQPAGIVSGIFAGQVAEVDTTNTTGVITANDYRSLLSFSMPRHFWQAGCRHTLFDAGCTLAASAFALNGTVGTPSTPSSIVCVGLGAPGGSGTFVLGRIVFTSGLNSGFSRTISNASSSGPVTVQLLNPLPYPVSPGDAFTIYPGCNKTFATCGAFGNAVNFGGQPFIPNPETST